MSIKESLQFEQQLYDLINNCGLPVSTAFYILKAVYLDFEKTLLKCADSEGETYTQEEKTYELYDKEKKENEDEQGTINSDIE